MNYATLEEQETPTLVVEKTPTPSYAVQAIPDDKDTPNIATTPNLMQGIDSLPKETKTRLPSNPHLPIVTIKPYTDETK